MIPPIYVVNSIFNGSERIGATTHETRDSAEALAAQLTKETTRERVVRAYVPEGDTRRLAAAVDKAQAMVSSLELEVIALREEIASLRLARAEIRQAMDEARAAASLS